MQYCFYIDDIEFCATFYRDSHYGIQLDEIEITCPELYPELSVEDPKRIFTRGPQIYKQTSLGKDIRAMTNRELKQKYPMCWSVAYKDAKYAQRHQFRFVEDREVILSYIKTNNMELLDYMENFTGF